MEGVLGGVVWVECAICANSKARDGLHISSLEHVT
jgi:hypothetical protein